MSAETDARVSAPRGDAADLARALQRMDGAGYGRYKQLAGAWDFASFTLTVERVQADPFAPPSRLTVRVPSHVAGLPPDVQRTAARRRALADYLARAA
ncbi:MAG: ABC-ATPase domain-containing protein, partial [Streptomycetales bacterium]